MRDLSTQNETTSMGAMAPAWNRPGAAGEDRLTEEDRRAIDSFLHDPTAMNVPTVESPFLETILQASGLAPDIAGAMRSYARDGFLVLEDMLEPDLIDEIAGRMHWLFTPEAVADAPQGVRDLFDLDPNRRQDAWWVCEAVGRLACHPTLLGGLELLYGRKPIPFQTLNFRRGTEQPTHSDAIHFSSMPERFMCGIWVALEDITEDNGPLVYYPGSHRLPQFTLEQLGLKAGEGHTAHGPSYARFENYVRAVVQACGLQEKRLTVKKGTALIWASNLLHGGSAIRRAGASRLSQVTHYYFEGCMYWAPILSEAAVGEYRVKPIHDLRTRQPVPHTINGRQLTLLPGTGHNQRLSYDETDLDERAALRKLKEKQRVELEQAQARASQLQQERDAVRERAQAMLRELEVLRRQMAVLEAAQKAKGRA